MTRSSTVLRTATRALTLLAAGTPVLSQSTTRLSLGPMGVEGNGNSRTVSVSADGTAAVFGSTASNLVFDDTNASDDVFVHDRTEGITTRISVSSGGAQADGGSYTPAISADGRFIAFHSFAQNLVAGDTNGAADVFVHDRMTATTVRASLSSAGAEGNGDSLFASISADGRYVAFQSQASDLVPGDANGHQDIFVRDLQTGTTVLASLSTGGAQGDGDCFSAVLSADGGILLFDSRATNLVPGDLNLASDVFVRDLAGSTTSRISVSSTGVGGNASSFAGALSADGRYAAFASQSSNLAPFDGNSAFDVFLHDRLAATTARLSTAKSGRSGNGDSFTPSISANGRFVTFQSVASNLIAGDTDGTADIFLWTRGPGGLSRVSVGANGLQADSYSAGPSISADGREIAFYSDATNLAPDDTNGFLDVFVHDLECSGVDPAVHYCFGDGSEGACPCANGAGQGRGCPNSANPDGARFRAAGSTGANSVTGADSIVLCAEGVPDTATVMLFQSSAHIPPSPLGDGLRCTGGSLRNLATKSAVGGAIVYPGPGDPSVAERSENLGDPILGSGGTRYYQALYRDTDPDFCPAPQGGMINATNGLILVW